MEIRATRSPWLARGGESLDFFAVFDYLASIPSPACRLEALSRADINSRPLPGTFFERCHMATAILVDGAFFLRRFSHVFPDHERENPRAVAHGLGMLAYWHLVQRLGSTQVMEQVARHDLLAESRQFYRIFFYDCQPLTKRMHTPLGKKSVDFGKSSEALFRLELHREVLKLRKVALRLGRLNDTSRWRLSEKATARLIGNPQTFAPRTTILRSTPSRRVWTCG